MKTWRAWTQKEIGLLEELRLAGLSSPAIAAAMGRTIASVKNRLAAEGFARVGNREAWLRVLNRPHTIEGAAIEMRVSKWAVKQAKRRLRRAGFAVPAAERT